MWVIAVQKLISIIFVCLFVGFDDAKQGKLSMAHLIADSHMWTERLSFLDGRFYVYLAKEWYSSGDVACAFYPLFPFLIRITTTILGCNAFASALLLSNAFSIGGSFVFYRFVSSKYGERIALTSLCLLLAFPGAICFGLIYTEALFLLLSMLLFVGLYERRTWLVCLSGFLTPLTRPVEILLVLPLAWNVSEKLRRAVRPSGRIATFDAPPLTPTKGRYYEYNSDRDERRNAPGRAAKSWSITTITNLLLSEIQMHGVLAILAGYATYFWIMHHATGDLFAGFKAQGSYPNSPSIANILDIDGFVKAFQKFGQFHGMLDSMIDRLLFLLFQ